MPPDPNRPDPIDELKALTSQAQALGGEAAKERQHKQGKLTARERIDLLLVAGGALVPR